MLQAINRVLVLFVAFVPVYGLAQGAGSNVGAGCSPPTSPNANRLALLRWYGANTAATYSVGGNPLGMVFDGSSMWVVNI